jgi:hypothetical protein
MNVWTICPACGWKGWRDEGDPAQCDHKESE